MSSSHPVPLELLLVIAHPDDEVYGAGGILLNCTRAGHQAGVLTFTHGEKGRTLGLAEGPEATASLRASEHQACLDLLGVQVREHHRFPDGGLNAVPVEHLSEVVQQALRKHSPRVVVTFPPNGTNGHRDHVATHQAVMHALQHVPVPEVWYFSGVAPADPQLQAAHLPPNLQVEVGHHLTTKLRAMACYRSQALSTVAFLQEHAERITRETFHRVEQQGT